MDTESKEVGTALKRPVTINSFVELVKALRDAAGQGFQVEDQFRMDPLERHMAEYLADYLDLALKTGEIPDLKNLDLYDRFAHNLVKGWIYLCGREGRLPSRARYFFKQLTNRDPANVLDITGKKDAKADAELLVRIIEKSTASIRLPDALRNYLSAYERTLQLKIDELVDAIQREDFYALKIVAGFGRRRYHAPGGARLRLEQDGTQVALVFRHRWRPFSKLEARFVGDARTLSAKGLKLSATDLPLGTTIRFIDAFIAKYKKAPRDLEAVEVERWTKAHGPATGIFHTRDAKVLDVADVALA